jgi:hypothetical protein
MGIVYVLVNRAMPDLVKIGKTEQTLELRIKGLDTTGVPLPFECYYAAEVSDHNEVEKKLHKTFLDKRVRDSREFFRVDPEQVKAALSLAAEKDVTPKNAIYTEKSDAEALERESRKSNFTFSAAKIPIGSIINFSKDEKITAKVLSDTTIDYEGQETSLSKAAFLAIKRCGYDWSSVQGPAYWLYEGETLQWHRRNNEYTEA